MTYTFRDAGGKVKPNFAEQTMRAQQDHRNQLEYTYLKNELVKNGGHNGKF